MSKRHHDLIGIDKQNLKFSTQKSLAIDSTYHNRRRKYDCKLAIMQTPRFFTFRPSHRPMRRPQFEAPIAMLNAQKPAPPPRVAFTWHDDEARLFDADILSAFSQSSGTYSFESAVEVAPAQLATFAPILVSSGARRVSKRPLFSVNKIRATRDRSG